VNILIFCTYPINNPRHGGQLRVRNIVDSYRSAGHVVNVVGVLGSPDYEREEGFLSFPGMDQLSAIVVNPFLMEDYAIGELVVKSNEYYEKLISKVKISPDLIHVEQPWLFFAAQKFQRSSAPDAKIIYGSQNVEWRLKQEILSSYFDAKTVSSNASLIRAVELNAAASADAVVCVSEGDALWHKAQTGKTIVVAANGVKPWRSDLQGRKEAAAITQNNKYVLYCASGHPPNLTGFFNIFSGGFGSLKPDEVLVVAGGVGAAIKQDSRLQKSAKLAEKLVVAGVVSQACLDGLLDGAHCIALPLTQGGGTNLKTAEALWSGKHVVATSVAMRGFEQFIGQKGVQIADTPSQFKRAIRDAMAGTPIKLNSEELNFRRLVLWESCLRPLSALVENIYK
jgi:hypothetical protein